MVQVATKPAHADEAAAEPPPNGFADLRRLVAPVRGRLVSALGLSGLSGASWVMALVFAAAATARLLDGADDGIWGPIGAMAVAAIAATLLKTLSSKVSHHAAFDHEVILRRQITDHLGRLPIGVVQGIGSGGLKKVIQDDVRGLHALVADAPPLTGAFVVAPVVGLIAMMSIEWRLGLVAFAVVPLLFVLMGYLMRDFPEQQQRYDEAQEGINAAVVEYVQGMEEVRTFDGASSSYSTFVRRNDEFTTFYRDWTDRSRGGALVARLLIAPLPMMVIVLLAGVPMVSGDLIAVGDLIAIVLLAPLLVESVLPLMWMASFFNRSKVSASRIAAILDMEPLAEPPSPQEPIDGSIRFESVRFRYDEARAPALDGVSFDVEDGTVCALVGSSGSGKSTIARLVPRFHDVDEGRVVVGGVDVRNVASEHLLRHVALVFQDPFLVRASVRENLRMGRPDADDEEIEAAARAARAHDFVMELPDGYDTVVGERGDSLSGGQRQRLTIARALLADAPIVVLDEATSFADPENEAEIQLALADLTRDKTVLVIAHRLSTIADVDQIVVLDEGRVAETGSHDQLLDAGGAYAQMWANHRRAMAWGIRSGEHEEATP